MFKIQKYSQTIFSTFTEEILNEKLNFFAMQMHALSLRKLANTVGILNKSPTAVILFSSTLFS